MTRLTRQLLLDELGATAIEYTLIAILTAIVAIAGLSLFAKTVTDKFYLVRDSVSAAGR